MGTHFSLVATSIACGLFVGMLAMIAVGRRVGRRRAETRPEAGRDGLGGPEGAVYGLLLALVSALMVGFGMASNKGRSVLHEMAYAAVLSTVIFLILDLEFPRLGFIRIGAADHVLIDLRQGMN